MKKKKRTSIILLLIGVTGLVFYSGAWADIAEWPLEIKGENGKVAIYQPEPEALEDNNLTARAAVAVIPQDREEPLFGVVWFEARISTDRDTRMVIIDDIQVSRVRIQDAAEDQEASMAQFLTENFPKSDIGISLDQLLATLETVEQDKIAAENLENTPPRIIFSTRPSVLITIYGPPELQPVENTNLMRVINTPFFISFDRDLKKYFLKGGTAWFSATDITGEWKLESDVPQAVLDQGLSEKKDREIQPEGGASEAPYILVATEPTELIVTEGEPRYTPLSGTNLMYVSNTESDLFLDMESQVYFVLLAGRWFKAGTLEGPWEYVAADRLPEDFAQIPPDSEIGDVLVSVAGTDASQAAVIEAGIPQTTVLKREQDVDLAVAYDGQPRFEPIESTDLSYAANTPYPVIEANQNYYCCYEAAWYVASTPQGPWAVATQVPRAIYTIPPSCPVYNVRYVQIYDSTPQEVYVGYLPGYMGSYVYGPTVVYGTGYRYPGWRGSVYYPRQITWGFHASYSFATNSWNLGFGFGVNRSWYRPLAPGGGWFGPGFGAGFVAGAITARTVHNWWGPGGWPRPAPYRGRIHSQTGNINIGRRNPRYHGNIYNRPRNRPRNSAPRKARPVQLPERKFKEKRNIFTDRQGNVYRKNKDGWQTRQKGDWKKADPSRFPTGSRPDRKLPTGPRPGQKPPTGAWPGQKPPTGAWPGQKPPLSTLPGQKPPTGIKPGQRPPTGTRPGQKPPTGVKPGQKPPTGIKPGQRPPTGAPPGQRPPTGIKPGQRPPTGIKPGQKPPTGVKPGQRPPTGTPPGQRPPTGVKPGQRPPTGIKPGQRPPTGTPPGQRPPTGIKPGQRPPTSTRPVQRPPTGIKPGQRPPTSTRPVQRPPTSTRPGQRAPTSIMPGQRPPTGTRPVQRAPTSIMPGQRPPTGTRPVQRPPTSIMPGQRPPTGTRPVQRPPTSVRPGQRPPTSTRPVQMPPTNVRPGQSPPTGSRPGQRSPTNLRPRQQSSRSNRPVQNLPRGTRSMYKPPTVNSGYQPPRHQLPNREKKMQNNMVTSQKVRKAQNPITTRVKRNM